MMSPARSASPTTQPSASLTSPKFGGCLSRKFMGRTGVVAGAGDRLRDFVRQRGGQFSHYAHAVHVGEIRLHLLQLCQRSFAILNVRQQIVPAHDAPEVIANWDASAFRLSTTTVVDVAHGLVLLFKIGTRALVWGFLCQGICQGRASFSFVGFLI